MKRLDSLEVSLSESVYWRGRAERENFRCVCPRKQAMFLPDESMTTDFVEAEAEAGPRRNDSIAPVEEL